MFSQFRSVFSTKGLQRINSQISKLCTENSRFQGVVTRFDRIKGYGFIEVTGDGSEIFVHHTEIKSSGFRKLVEGQEVEFSIGTRKDDPQKRFAVEVTGPNGEEILSLPNPDYSNSRFANRERSERKNNAADDDAFKF